MNKYFLIVLSMIFIISCVGPEEPLDGLYENTPVVVNTEDAFTFSIRAENYTIEKTYNLAFKANSDSINLTTVLIVTDFAGSASDTSYFDIFKSNNSVLAHYDINSDIYVSPENHLDSTEIPTEIFFKADDFSGLIQLVLAIGD